MRIALIGAGHIGQFHGRLPASRPGASVIVADAHAFDCADVSALSPAKREACPNQASSGCLHGLAQRSDRHQEDVAARVARQ